MEKFMWGIDQKKSFAMFWVFSVATLTTLFGICGSVNAFEIKTGNEDIKLRWDNTFRYNLGVRTSGQNSSIIANPNNDDGDRNFDVGIVTNRLDILSELDAVYKRDYGIRLSGAGWYDQRYHDHLDNTSVATSNHFENGQQTVGLSSFADRYYAGPSGELLDAFAFGKFQIGDIPIRLKVGRHTIFWGESLLLGGAIHGISYAQSPLDLAKGFAVPGTEAKELFRPLNNVSVLIQPTDTLSIAAQYFLQWESNRLPEAGTYFGLADAYLDGAESLILGPNTFAKRGYDIIPNQAKDWGVAARWTPEWLDGTLGLYYRHFSDKLPQVILDANTFQYHLDYAQDIDLVGMSLARQILGVSVGAELSYRFNMPLNSDVAMVSVLPGKGETAGARGDTWHGVLNFLGLINKTPLFDSATWLSEFTWNRWQRVAQNENVFMGRDGRSGIDKVTKDAFAMGINFTPTWFHVLPGMDLSMPLTYTRGISGNSAVLLGGTKDAGTYSAGLSADLYQKYKFDIKYADFYGDFTTDPTTGAVAVANGLEPLLKDRGAITFTFKTTF
jgi:Protein of unknown function (DUF1302)